MTKNILALLVLILLAFAFLKTAESAITTNSILPKDDSSVQAQSALSGLLKDSTSNWGKTFACIIFGGVGFVAFVYGKKNGYWRKMLLGVALSIYPYFISVSWEIYLIGLALCAALYFWQD
ncbi:MAG: hypothetical protein HQL26_05135 [Candidatus Omnitrophica bacterium]|nr:hypothetical protein [Candidatus Omnitrophota bacterium]